MNAPATRIGVLAQLVDHAERDFDALDREATAAHQAGRRTSTWADECMKHRGLDADALRLSLLREPPASLLDVQLVLISLSAVLDNLGDGDGPDQGKLSQVEVRSATTAVENCIVTLAAHAGPGEIGAWAAHAVEVFKQRFAWRYETAKGGAA